MSIVLLFLALVFGTVFWWLSTQSLLTEPWLDEGAGTDVIAPYAVSSRAAKLGLSGFLVVVGSLFTLLISAYFMRNATGEFRSASAPAILWLNTSILIGSCCTLHYARFVQERLGGTNCNYWLLASLALCFLFLVGQCFAWRQLMLEGDFVATSVSAAFFYLLTGLHALHLLGGQVALAHAAGKEWSGKDPEVIAGTLALCNIYMDFMLFVWLAIFVVLMGGGEGLAAICRRVLI